jgi:hypothetical protein
MTTTATTTTTTTRERNSFNDVVIMDEIDHVANRVGLCTFLGLLGGAVFATYRDYPRRSTALKVAASCSIVATGLFGTERLANLALRSRDGDSNLTTVVVASHACAGIWGGGLNGYLYQKKPLRGMFWGIPVMLGVAFMELEFQRMKQRRIQELAERKLEDRSDGGRVRPA